MIPLRVLEELRDFDNALLVNTIDFIMAKMLRSVGRVDAVTNGRVRDVQGAVDHPFCRERLPSLLANTALATARQAVM